MRSTPRRLHRRRAGIGETVFLRPCTAEAQDAGRAHCKRRERYREWNVLSTVPLYPHFDSRSIVPFAGSPIPR